MVRIRPSGERGVADFGWLKSRHTFSFGHYYDPEFMGHGPLRVINEDRVTPGRGFGAHSHADMEILSWVLSGSLEHRDSIGSTASILPGELQRMSAGTGITHSEYNGSRTEPVHFLQIWIIPEEEGLRPGYEQRRFEDADLANRLKRVASGDGREGSVRIHQDAELYIGRLAAGTELVHPFKPRRLGWVQLAKGTIELDGQALEQGDGAAIDNAKSVRIRATADAEVLLFDLAP